ncbi:MULTISPECIES: regulatory protein RecX [Ruminococcus]|jgi:regulatory protein|uniref:regulatory protein RecX n=1 Tax=Ruminococcus TaxID=1263 RepID=UPI00033D9929|nr:MULTISPECIES: regulatory protein RecX [Ruminococcus]MED9891646.1 regulatory protein RecX [Ruminococcus champanellensis]CDD52782.1 regulatory protein RecX [Ruminococcus sp. CAG:379]
MKITDITPYKGSVLQIDLEDADPLFIHRDIAADFHLAPGLELPEGAVEQIHIASQRRRAYERALYLLDVRAYGFAELFEKLEQNYEEDVCYHVLRRLVRLGMINDRRYAASLAEKYVTIKHYGLYRAKQEMRRKGLDDELIDEALADYEEETDAQLAALLERKYAADLQDPTDQKRINRVKAALVRRGYGYDAIRCALEDYFSE